MTLTRSFVAGLPQLDIHTLSEDWALATALEQHWMLLADSVGLRPSQWIDAQGDRMYGAVIALSTRFDLARVIAEDDAFTAATRFVSIRKPHALSVTEFAVEGEVRADVRLLSSFIKRVTKGSNKKFSKVRDLWTAPDESGSEVDDLLQVHHQLKASDVPGAAALSYEVNRVQDFNTADFLYFKNFVRIAKAAEWRANRGQATRLNSERSCYYYGNVDDGDTVHAIVTREGDRTHTVLADATGRKLFLSVATCPIVTIAPR